MIDGDNVAHVRGGSEEYERMRAELVAAVVDHAAQSGAETVLVFDGHGRDNKLGAATVRYAGTETADTLIERLAHRSQHDREVTVVSSDTVLRHVAAAGRGGRDERARVRRPAGCGAAPDAPPEPRRHALPARRCGSTRRFRAAARAAPPRRIVPAKTGP